ncbi:TRAP transporter small permease subunit [Mangrovicoccus ximenensis]|uniref:TRAP transporter small permease subunit n=1 Tax=Mangrovicoccus ximenensis TaxID=1911570 RepID=UPI000D39808E|nr:TRAP transporter small permease [Mangrovicoccus ximenensis]
MSLRKTHAGLEKVARAAAIAGGLGMILVAVMITIDVILRKFTPVTLGGATEIAGFVFAAATAVAYPYALIDRANIRIDPVYTHLPPRIRAVLDAVAMVLLLIFVATLTKSIYGVFSKSWNSGTMTVGVVSIPLWMPQFFWMLGYVLFFLTALFLAICAVVSLLRRDYAHVNRVAGIPSIEEAIEEETHIDVSHHQKKEAR